MRILFQTLKLIEDTFFCAPIEAGGMIGSKKGTICAFYFDEGNYNNECYIPNTYKLNKKIIEWAKVGIAFAGIIHSHPNQCKFLSDSDVLYAHKIIEASGKKCLYFPIVTINNGKVFLTGYKVKRKRSSYDKIYTVKRNNL